MLLRSVGYCCCWWPMKRYWKQGDVSQVSVIQSVFHKNVFEAEKVKNPSFIQARINLLSVLVSSNRLWNKFRFLFTYKKCLFWFPFTFNCNRPMNAQEFGPTMICIFAGGSHNPSCICQISAFRDLWDIQLLMRRKAY